MSPRRPRPPRIQLLLVLLGVLIAAGVILTLSALANKQLLQLIEGISLAVVALLCLAIALRRTRT